MTKKIYIPLFGIILIGLILGANPINAQTELPSPGITPDSPFYFIERFFEGVGTLFTFGDLNKAERYANLAAKRMAEVQTMAEKNNSKAAEKALQRYEEQTQKALVKAEEAQNKGKKIEQITEIMARNTNRHILVLEKVLEKVPEQAKQNIERVREMSIERQKNILTKLSEENLEKAVEINLEAVENRINRAKEMLEKNRTENVEKNIEEFKNQHNFGEEISQIAQQLGKDTTTAEQLIGKATSIHLQILNDIYERVPEQAKESIEKAIENSIKGHERAVEALRNKNALKDVPEEIPLPESMKEEIKEIIQERVQESRQMREKIQEQVEQKTQEIESAKEQVQKQIQEQKIVNYPETLTVLGETKLTKDIIAEERARIESEGYQAVCVKRIETLKGFMNFVDEETAEILLEIINDLCEEYKP